MCVSVENAEDGMALEKAADMATHVEGQVPHPVHLQAKSGCMQNRVTFWQVHCEEPRGVLMGPLVTVHTQASFHGQKQCLPGSPSTWLSSQSEACSTSCFLFLLPYPRGLSWRNVRILCHRNPFLPFLQHLSILCPASLDSPPFSSWAPNAQQVFIHASSVLA